MARVQFEGRTRRIAASRIAWALATGQWPKGVVRARNGIDDDLRFDNLILTERGPRPFTKSRRRQSLVAGAPRQNDHDADQDARRASGIDGAATVAACRVERVVRLHSAWANWPTWA